jgi:hypothetical protein
MAVRLEAEQCDQSQHGAEDREQYPLHFPAA